MVAMYATVLICPRVVRIFRSNFVRMGHIVFTIRIGALLSVTLFCPKEISACVEFGGKDGRDFKVSSLDGIS